MGLFDSLKKATGIGLSAREHYDRAFEKGVLLGPKSFGDAAKFFETAAKKAAEAGEVDLQTRASANSRLYAFVAGGPPKLLIELRDSLKGLTEIEQLGSRSDVMPTANLALEVEARLLEAQAESITSNPKGRADAHLQAADAFKRFFNAPLATYRFRAQDIHTETAQQRFFYNQALAAWYQGVAAVLINPETASEQMAKALNAFRQCKDEKWATEAETGLVKLRARRTCWMCHREFQGESFHFGRYPSLVAPYVADVVAKAGQDASSLDVASGEVVLCMPCGKAVERQADLYATRRTEELRQEVDAALTSVRSEIADLQAMVNRLAAIAHSH